MNFDLHHKKKAMTPSEKTYQKAFHKLLLAILFFILAIGGSVWTFYSFISGFDLIGVFGVCFTGSSLYACLIFATQSVNLGFRAEREERDEWSRTFRPRI